MSTTDLDPIGTAILGDAADVCRWCSYAITAPQELSWGICTSCYDECIAESQSAATS